MRMMRLSFAITATALVSLSIQSLYGETAIERNKDRPNVLIILADDLGYSDIGCYGGEIETPALDSLAKNGLRLTDFYNTGRCWPTRASMLTGYYAQQVGRDRLPGVKRGGAQNKRPAWAKLLPERLKKYQYRAYHAGKWHIDGTPLQGGFDRSYWTPDHGRFFSPKRHLEDDIPLPAVARGTDYYATTAIADHAIRYLKDHETNHADKPFFSFVAFTAPHFPLHARADDIERYQATYQPGWDVIRQRRWERIQNLGLANGPLSKVEMDIGPPYDFPNVLETIGLGEVNRPISWDQLTPQQQQLQSVKMSIHAAMVHRMDAEIGRIVSQLKDCNQLDNTLILFLSDNGASAEMMIRDDGHDANAQPGSADTHLCLGPGWSSVANTPFRRHKTWVHEGGIATPFIAHWPRGISARGGMRRFASHVIDVVPTILDAAGEKLDSNAIENGMTPPRPGRSLLPGLQKKIGAGAPSKVTMGNTEHWWLHEGNRAIRRGKWKLVSAKDDPWELYDLSIDRNETQNLAETKLELVQSLESAWKAKTSEYKKQVLKDYNRSKEE